MCGSESGLCAKGGKGGVGQRSFSNWRWDWYGAGADADRERRYKLTRRATTTTTTATRITRSKIQNCGVSTTILLLGLTGWLTHRLTRWLTRSLAFLALLIATTTVAPPTWRHDYMLRLIQSHTQTYIRTEECMSTYICTLMHSSVCVCVHTLSHTFWIYLLACQPEAKAGQQQQQCAATRRGETSGERTAGVGERERKREVRWGDAVRHRRHSGRHWRKRNKRNNSNDVGDAAAAAAVVVAMAPPI